MKKIIPVVLVSIVCLAFSFSDIGAFKVLLLNKLENYTSTLYPEKIYIHSDKPYYTAGEDIWFSAYLLNGVFHTKSEKSRVMYVQLVNEIDSIISEHKLFIEKPSVSGDFKIPTDLKEGNYRLVAFSNYMRNQPQDYFFMKELKIFSLNPTDESNTNLKTNKQLPDIGFYPEGGYLITDLNNKVAVKIKNAALDENEIIGIIEDAEGNQVSNFKTAEFGMASFNLKPKIGEKYIAKVSFGDEDIIYNLPIPLEKGYVLSTSQNESDVIIKVSTNTSEGLKNTLIIGHQRGIAAFDYINETTANSILVKIPKQDLIEGILDIVLFNSTEKPVAERLVFIKKENTISVSLKKTNGTETSIRDLVNLEVAVKNTDGKELASTLSMSITDANLIKHDNNAENIKTYLLLNSDLRGTIKSPNYFFEGDYTVKKSYLLDLIMLTHGWSRFTWQELMKQNTFQEFKPEKGIYISGYVTDAEPPYKTKSSETKLTLRKEGFFQEIKQTEENGKFSYGPYEFSDEVDVLIQAGDAINTEAVNLKYTNITINDPTERPKIISEKDRFYIKQDIPNIENYINKSRNNVVRNFGYDQERQLLSEVNLQTTLISKEEIKEIERNRRTRSFTPSHRIVVDDYGDNGAGDFMSLISNTPGIRVVPDQFGGLIATLRGLEPAYYLNDVKVDLNTVKYLTQADIDFIDIRNTGPASAAYGLDATGVIAIYLRQGSRNYGEKAKKSPGSINFKVEGFYKARSFYAPEYASTDTNNSKIDRRTTLYWNPLIETKNNTNPEVAFYTSDETGTYQIEIEGITITGIPFHQTTFIEVE